MPESQEVSLTSPEMRQWFELKRRELRGVKPLAEAIGIGKNALTDYLLGHREMNSRTEPFLLDFAMAHGGFAWAARVKAGDAPEMPATVPQSPVKRVHHEGATELRAWLWDYTIRVSRAVVEEIAERGPAIDDDSHHPEAAATPSAPAVRKRSARG